MDIRATLRLSLLLVAGILMTSVLKQEWLSYLAVGLSGLLFMCLWWIAICCFAYWSEKQEHIVPIRKSEAPGQEPLIANEPETAAMYEVLVPSGQVVSE